MAGFWAFDLGNLNWKAGYFADGKLKYVFGIDPDDVYKREYDCRLLRSHASFYGGLSDEPYVATPAPNRMMQSYFEEIVDCMRLTPSEKGSSSPHYLSAEVELPFRIHYTEGAPGADRLANVLAMRAMAPGELTCSVDMGTATNFEIVDEAGDFLGGAIMGGIELQVRALHVKTDRRLPYFELDEKNPPAAIGRSTKGAISSGLIIGHQGAIRGMIDAFTAELGRRPRVFLTGGDSRFIEAKSVGAERVENLTLKGLAEYQKLITS